MSFNNISINADKRNVLRKIQTSFARPYWESANRLITSLSNDVVTEFVNKILLDSPQSDAFYVDAAIGLYKTYDRSSEWIIQDSIKRVRKAIVRRYEADRMNNARRLCSLSYDGGNISRQWVVICALKGDSGFPQEYAVRNIYTHEYRIVIYTMMSNLY